MIRRRWLIVAGMMGALAGCSAKPAPITDLGITVSAERERCLLALKGTPVGGLDDFQTKLKLKAALPHPPFSTGIHTVGTVPSACIQKVYEVLRTAHVQTVGIIVDAGQPAPVQP